MSGGCLSRVVAVVAGLVLGLVVLLVVASTTGGGAGGGGNEGAAPAGGGEPVGSATAVRGAPPPTQMPGARPIGSLAELAGQAGSLRGQLVQVRVTEQELTQEAERYIRSQGTIPVTRIQVRLRPGQVVVSGTARQGALASDFVVRGRPALTGGGLSVVVESVEPAILGQAAQIGPGRSFELVSGLAFEAQSVEVAEGVLVATGVVR